MNIYPGFLRYPLNEVKVTKFRLCLIRTFCSEFIHNFPSIPDIISEQNKNECMKRIQSIRISPRELTDNNRKRAAVLIPLCIIDKQLSFLYTLRRENLKRHRGQVSFPGGIEDATDSSLVDTALRETEEELGISKESVKVWGSGSIVVGNEFSVLPVLGYLGPLKLNQLKPNPDEVEMAFTIPLQHFCSEENCRYTQFRYSDTKGYVLPVYVNGRCRVWGITALITHIVLTSLLPNHYKQKLEYIKPLVLHPPVL